MNWLDVPAEKHGFWEIRMKVGRIIDDMKIPFNSGVDVMEVYRLIVKYSQEQRRAPFHYNWAISEHGMLTVNGKNLARVAPLQKGGFPCKDNAAAYYWEDQILARQERYTD